MTPRTEIEAVPATSALEELCGLRRRPAPAIAGLRGLPRQRLGIVYARELFKHRPRPRRPSTPLAAPPALATPETKDAAEASRICGRRDHTAVVVDEYGGTAGFVTLRDLLEALVGRIETSRPRNAPSEGTLKADGTILLDGMMRVEEFEELPTSARLTNPMRASTR